MRFDGRTGDTCANGRQLTSLDFVPNHPSWGPSNFIAFDSRGASSDIYILALGDGSSTPVVYDLPIASRTSAIRYRSIEPLRV